MTEIMSFTLTYILLLVSVVSGLEIKNRKYKTSDNRILKSGGVRSSLECFSICSLTENCQGYQFVRSSVNNGMCHLLEKLDFNSGGSIYVYAKGKVIVLLCLYDSCGLL